MDLPPPAPAPAQANNDLALELPVDVSVGCVGWGTGPVYWARRVARLVSQRLTPLWDSLFFCRLRGWLGTLGYQASAWFAAIGLALVPALRAWGPSLSAALCIIGLVYSARALRRAYPTFAQSRGRGGWRRVQSFACLLLPLLSTGYLLYRLRLLLGLVDPVVFAAGVNSVSSFCLPACFVVGGGTAVALIVCACARIWRLLAAARAAAAAAAGVLRAQQAAAAAAKLIAAVAAKAAKAAKRAAKAKIVAEAQAAAKQLAALARVKPASLAKKLAKKLAVKPAKLSDFVLQEQNAGSNLESKGGLKEGTKLVPKEEKKNVPKEEHNEGQKPGPRFSRIAEYKDPFANMYEDMDEGVYEDMYENAHEDTYEDGYEPEPEREPARKCSPLDQAHSSHETKHSPKTGGSGTAGKPRTGKSVKGYLKG